MTGTIVRRSVYVAFMAPRVIWVLVMVLLLPLLSVAQQAKPAPGGGSAYVVVWPGSKEFHTPSCPLIKDAKGVSVLTRAQANGKGYKQHKDCDPATIAEKNAPTMVYVSESDKVYHRADCKLLPKDAKKVVLDEKAVKGRWPCTVCRPPIRPTGPKAFNR
jgi:hypothetical protein